MVAEACELGGVARIISTASSRPSSAGEQQPTVTAVDPDDAGGTFHIPYSFYSRYIDNYDENSDISDTGYSSE